MSLSKQVQRAQSAKQSTQSAPAPIDPMAMMQQMMAMMQAAAQQQSAPQSTTVTGNAAQQSIQGKNRGKRRQRNLPQSANAPQAVRLSVQAELGYCEFTNQKGELVRKHVVGFPCGWNEDGTPRYSKDKSSPIYGDTIEVVREKVRSMAIAVGLIAE